MSKICRQEKLCLGLVAGVVLFWVLLCLFVCWFGLVLVFERMANGEEKSNDDLYAVLGLEKECTASELRNAYKKLALVRIVNLFLTIFFFQPLFFLWTIQSKFKRVFFESQKHVLKSVFLSLMLKRTSGFLLNYWKITFFSIVLQYISGFYVWVFPGKSFPRNWENCSKKKYFFCWDRNGTQIAVQLQGIQSSWKKLSKNSRPSNKLILVNKVCFTIVMIILLKILNNEILVQ